MQILKRLIDWYGKTAVFGFFVVLTVLLAAGIYIYVDREPEETPTLTDTAVSTQRVSELANGRTLELIGSVEALDQNVITTEASGRVVRVNVELGGTVRAGQIIATLENASERAAVLQAEGAYEAALAGAAQSDVSVEEAQNTERAAEDSAVTAFKSAFNTFRDILLNDIDDVYTEPTGSFPGLRIAGGTDTAFLNSERIRFQSVLSKWRERADTISTGSDLPNELSYASTRLNELANVIDILLERVNDDDSEGILSASELRTISRALSNDRASVNSSLSSIDRARTTLLNARESLRRAQLGGTGTQASAGSAQVKQALGSLRAAEANLEKTILRTSISGTVNSLSIQTGDFVGMNEVVARIANNEALEVTTYISETERDSIAIGDTVTLSGRFEGTITNIAPAVDPETRKIEVKIAAATGELENGDTVRISIEPNEDLTPVDGPLSIPITALKVGTDRTVVFTVNDENTLVAHEVVVGPLLGSNVLIESGITPQMEIVVDARGFNEGDRVTVRN